MCLVARVVGHMGSIRLELSVQQTSRQFRKKCTERRFSISPLEQNFRKLKITLHQFPFSSETQLLSGKCSGASQAESLAFTQGTSVGNVKTVAWLVQIISFMALTSEKSIDSQSVLLKHQHQRENTL